MATVRLFDRSTTAHRRLVGFRGAAVVFCAATLVATAAACDSAPPTPSGRGPTPSAVSDASSPPSTPATTPRASGDLGVVLVAVPTPEQIRDTQAYGEIPIDQLIVVLAAGRGRSDAEALAADLGGSVVGQIDVINAFQMAVPATNEAELAALIAKAKAAAGVALVAPNAATKPSAGESDIWGVRTSPLEDPVYTGAAADGYKMIGVPAAWEYIRGSGMKLGPANVGIVDGAVYTGTGELTGDVTYTDPDGTTAAPAQVTYSNGTTGSDPAGSHATSVNILVGADRTNGGVVGIASPIGSNLRMSNTNLWSSKFGWNPKPAAPDPSDPTIQQWARSGTYAFADLAAIMEQVRNKPKGQPKVINLSWGPADYKKVTPDLVEVYRSFFTQIGKEYPDVIFVAAAGNESTKMEGDSYYPGGLHLSNMITVGNVTNDGKVFKESNTAGTDFELTVFAPGEQSVRGFDKADGVVVKDRGGTSMAAPQVTATIALLQSLNPRLTAAEIKDLIAASARKGPNGDLILAVDKAVFAVLDINCHVAGNEPCPTEKDLADRGAIDGVATPLADAPGEYLVRGIVQSAGGSGTDVTIDVQGGEVTKGETPRHLTAAGELGWTVKMDNDKGTVTVHRTDNGAGSVITLEKIDINGKWAGTFTVTKLDIDPELVKAAAEEGCSEGAIKEIVGKALPLTMDITVDARGNGTATTFIDLSSIKDPKGKPLSSKPSTAKIRYAGNQVTFLGEGSTLAGSMTGYVTKAGDVVSMRGAASAKDNGVVMKATWTVVQGG